MEAPPAFAPAPAAAEVPRELQALTPFFKPSRPRTGTLGKPLQLLVNAYALVKTEAMPPVFQVRARLRARRLRSKQASCFGSLPLHACAQRNTCATRAAAAFLPAQYRMELWCSDGVKRVMDRGVAWELACLLAAQHAWPRGWAYDRGETLLTSTPLPVTGELSVELRGARTRAWAALPRPPCPACARWELRARASPRAARPRPQGARTRRSSPPSSRR